MLASEVGKANFLAISGPNTLVLRFPAAYNQAKEYCQQPDRLARLEEAVRKLTGRPWSVRVEVAAEPAAGPGNGAANGAGAARPRARRGAKEEAEKLPLVRRALDVLGATITRVDEGFGTAADAGAAAPDARAEPGTADEEEA
jgi:DNA polymerase-3 subunit gamma/tau